MISQDYTNGDGNLGKSEALVRFRSNTRRQRNGRRGPQAIKELSKNEKRLTYVLR